MPGVVVLYEDSLSRDSRSPNQYLPHQFVLQCVADRTGMSHWNLKERVVGIPRNGAPNLKRDLDHPDKFRPRGEVLFFVADSDEIHAHFRIDRAEPEVMCQSILERVGNPGGIGFFLLVRNLETLVEAAARRIDREMAGKSHAERDAILGAMLHPNRRLEREALVSEVRMLREIVQAIEHAVPPP